MAFYEHTTGKIRAYIRRRFFTITPRFLDVDAIDVVELISHRNDIGSTESMAFYRMCQHLLWMLDELEKTSDAKKAARWIGYIVDRMEILGFMTNKESRGMINLDKDAGRE